MVVLFCISLIISEIQCLFTYLLFTYKLSLGKCLFKSWRALFITVRWRLSLDQVCTFRVQRQHSLWPTGIPGLGKQSSHITIDPRAKINEDSRCDTELNNSPVCWHSSSFHKLRQRNVFWSNLTVSFIPSILCTVILWYQMLPLLSATEVTIHLLNNGNDSQEVGNYLSFSKQLTAHPGMLIWRQDLLQ